MYYRVITLQGWKRKSKLKALPLCFPEVSQCKNEVDFSFSIFAAKPQTKTIFMCYSSKKPLAQVKLNADGKKRKIFISKKAFQIYVFCCVSVISWLREKALQQRMTIMETKEVKTLLRKFEKTQILRSISYASFPLYIFYCIALVLSFWKTLRKRISIQLLE